MSTRLPRRDPKDWLKDTHDDYVIETDGRTVWVNNEMLLGRFSRLGIDVHVKGQCIDGSCSPGPCGLYEWDRFKALMLEYHNIEVPDKHIPDYLNRAKNADQALYWKYLGEGREITVYAMTFGKARLNYGEDDNISNGYCYEDPALAIVAATLWGGEGDPIDGWHRNPYDGRRREGGDPNKEEVRA